MAHRFPEDIQPVADLEQICKANELFRLLALAEEDVKEGRYVEAKDFFDGFSSVLKKSNIQR